MKPLVYYDVFLVTTIAVNFLILATKARAKEPEEDVTILNSPSTTTSSLAFMVSSSSSRRLFDYQLNLLPTNDGNHGDDDSRIQHTAVEFALMITNGKDRIVSQQDLEAA